MAKSHRLVQVEDYEQFVGTEAVERVREKASRFGAYMLRLYITSAAPNADETFKTSSLKRLPPSSLRYASLRAKCIVLIHNCAPLLGPSSHISNPKRFLGISGMASPSTCSAMV